MTTSAEYTDPVENEADPTTGGRRRRRIVLVVVAAAVVVLAVVVLAVFQPQRLFIDTEVHEALPGLTSSVPDALPTPSSDASSDAPVSTSPTSTPAAGPVALARGAFTSIAHPTAGTALLVRLPDGGHLVRLEGLATDNGPDVWVGLSSAPAGSGDYSTLRRLEPLKGNIGDQNYAIPADVDVPGVRSVVIWCERFSVAFGDAPLDRPSPA